MPSGEVPDALACAAVEDRPMPEPETPRVLVAGGGVAGLETCLALRAFLGEADLSVDLLCREARFEYRPLAVLEPFEGAPAWSMELERFAADQDVRLIRDSLAAVQPETRVAVTAYSGHRAYDALVVCVGARAVRSLAGAITFRGGRDAKVVAAAIDAVRPGERATIAFAVPGETCWTLPLYELAILAARRLARRGTRAHVLLASPEASPLEVFGAQASAAVIELLDQRGVEFIGGTRPVAADAGELELDDGQRIPASAIVSLPRLLGRRVPGLPQDAVGFVAVDEHQRVPSAEGLYAAGDVTTFPFKQGGLAAQQADAAADRPAPVRAGAEGRALHRRRAHLPPRTHTRGRSGTARVLPVVAAEQDRRAPPGPVPDDARRSTTGAGAAPDRRRPPYQRRR
jgi:sulfide:quinone oxidoreductase